jgi:aminoglycoside phosphotransferase (APT) family kinase protein
MVVRLPRRQRTVEPFEKERVWLPRLAPQLPVAVPVPVADGEPDDAYPFPWAVYTWLRGEPLTEADGDQARLASDLAEFILALQNIDATNGPPPGRHNFHRGEPLVERDGRVRAAIAGSSAKSQPMS